MNKCRFCGSGKIVKNGFMEGKQRYKCKECGRNPTNSKKREYTKDELIKILKGYLNGMGFNAISRMLNISVSGIIHVIKKIGKKLEDIQSTKQITDKEIIEILEADELFTYVGRKKKSDKNMDGSK